MGRVSYAYEAFNAGYLSFALHGRTNRGLEPRNRGLRTALNMEVITEGPAVRRPGTEYIAEVADSDKAHRIFRFEFSETQAYALEFGDQTMRVFKDGGIVTSGGSPVSIVTPWSSADLADLYFTQSADVLFVAHPSYAPRTITRSSHTAWTIAEYEYLDGPYLDTNADETKTLTAAATTGDGIALTATGHTPFVASDVGRAVRLKHVSGDTTTWGYGTIATVTASNAATIDIVNDFGAATATSEWRLGSWSEATGWPHCSTIHQGRFAWGATNTEPQTFWLTRSGDYYDFAPTETDGSVIDSDGITLTLGATEVNFIRGMVSSDYLVVLTVGGEWRIVTTSSEPLSPTNGSARQDTSLGSANVQPVRFGTDTLFVQRQAKKIYGLRYSFESDALAPQFMNQLCRDIAGNGISELTYVREPDLGLWCLREDGYLLLMTYDPVQKVVGWTPHLIGGSYNGGNAVVESITAIPGDGRDEVWMIVKRTIDGSTKRYIERLSPYLFTEDGKQEDLIYTDSEIEFDGRNADLTDTFTLTGGGSWATGGTATITATSHAPFSAGSVGYVYGLQPEPDEGDGEWSVTDENYKVQITAVTTSNAAIVSLLSDIPTTLQSNATGVWARFVTSLSGADHLEGETVSILGDGAVQPDAVVTSGEVELKYRAAIVRLGLSYQSYMVPCRPDASYQYGTAQGKYQKVIDAYVRVWRSLGFTVGKDLDSQKQPLGRPRSTPSGTPVLLVSNDVRADIDNGWELSSDIMVYTDLPLPLMVLGIYAELAST